MIRTLGFVPFLALAGLFHLLVFLSQPDDGVSAGGVGGDQSVSLIAVSSSAEAMVAAWETPPQTLSEIPDVDTSNQAEVFAEQAALNYELSPDAAIKIPAFDQLEKAENAPNAAPRPVHTPITRNQPEVTEQITSAIKNRTTESPTPAKLSQDTQIQRTRPEQNLAMQTEASSLPTVDTSSPPPPTKPKKAPPPKSKEKPKKQAKRQDEKNSTASQGRAEQKAAGRSGKKVAGQDGAKTENSISKGKREKLLRVWQSQIQRRVVRKQVSVRNTRGGGRVVLSVKLNRNGSVLSKRIVRSSGNAKYDQAALQTLDRAGRLPAAPDNLATAPVVEMLVPITYK